jgi:hypothetical protein
MPKRPLYHPGGTACVLALAVETLPQALSEASPGTSPSQLKNRGRISHIVSLSMASIRSGQLLNSSVAGYFLSDPFSLRVVAFIHILTLVSFHLHN